MDQTLNRNFMILNVSDIVNINFIEILETSPESLSKSVDGSKTFVKWESEQVPTSIENLITKEGPYTNEEMSTILSSIEWTRVEHE